MKNTLLLTIISLLTFSTFAQSPDLFSYQAVVRDNAGNVVASSAVSLRFSILQTTATGTAQYVETHNPTTDANGLVSIMIGGGTVSSGTFASIDWANDKYFLKVELDPTGGSSFSNMGITQLISVPYAKHAQTADTINKPIAEKDPIFLGSIASKISSADTTLWNNKQDQLVAGNNISIVGNTINASNASWGSSTNKFYLGQDTLGGIVFYTYLDKNGNQHGLVVNKTDSSAQWQSIGSITNAKRSWDGTYNTSLMTGSPAANYVKGLTDGGFTDWYLPSIDELAILWHNFFHVNKALYLSNSKELSHADPYWSSSEHNATNAWFFATGVANLRGKTSTNRVRAVRAF